MDEENYEQLHLPRGIGRGRARVPPAVELGPAADGRRQARRRPAARSVELAVTETEPGVRGDTVSNVTKPATLETGAVVQVPLFVNVGDRIKVDPREKRYISRRLSRAAVLDAGLSADLAAGLTACARQVRTVATPATTKP